MNRLSIIPVKTKSFIAVMFFLLCLPVFFCGYIPSARGAEILSSEYAIKAAFLLNFGKYVGWPSSATASPGDVLNICILGADPFGDDIRSIDGKSLQLWKIKVRYLDSVEELPGEDGGILFISGSEKGNLSGIVPKLEGRAWLIVADQKDSLQQGVMINMFTVGDKVRFEINLGSAKRAGITISSQLLKLATHIVE